jgi:hypothetical protein
MMVDWSFIDKINQTRIGVDKMELLKTLNIDIKAIRSYSKKRKINNHDLPPHLRSIEIVRPESDMQIIAEDGGENFNSRHV